ncbi:MAG: FtsX-like permease family protein [Promethearchaeota archaeon]
MLLETLGSNLIIVIIPIVIGITTVLLWKDKKLVKLGFRNLRRRKVRNILTVAGIGLSVSLYVAFNVASENAVQSYLNVIELTGGKMDFEISRIDGEPFDEAILEDVLKVEGVKAAAPRIQRYCIIWVFEDGNSTAAQVIGIDPNYDNEFGDLFDYHTNEPINELVIGKNAIVSELLMKELTRTTENGKLINATVDDSLKIKYRTSDGNVKTRIFDLAAFAEATGKIREMAFGLSVFITLDAAQEFFPKTKGKIDKIIVEMDQTYKEKWQDVQQRIKEVVEEKDQDLEVFAPKRTQLENARTATAAMKIGILFAGMTCMLAMIFLIFNAINMTITERKYEIGVLRSIGFKKRHIFRLFFYEIIVLGVAGSATGIFAGVWLSRLLYLYLQNTAAFSTTRGVVLGTAGYVVEPELITINTAYLRDGFILGVIFTIIGGLYPLCSITSLKITNALRPGARITEKPTLRRRINWLTTGSVLLITGIAILFAFPLFSGLKNSSGPFLGPILAVMFMLMTATGIILIIGGVKRKYLVISTGIIMMVTSLIDMFYIGSFTASFVLLISSIFFTAGVLRGVGDFFNFLLKNVPSLRYVSSLASKNIARKPTRSTLTFGIFTVALAMVIITATITNAISTGILNWVDTNLEADMFVVSNVGAPPNLSGNITQNIQGIHWENTSEGWVPALTIQEMSGARFELWDEDYDSLLIGVNSTNYAVINKNAKIIEPNDTNPSTLFKRLKNSHENACIISDKLAYELNVKVGQKTPISVWAHGNYTEFKIVGILHNDLFGYPQAGFFAIIDIDKFYDLGFDETAHLFTIKLDKRYPNGTEVDPQVVADQIDAQWGDEYKLSFSLKEDIKKDINEQVKSVGSFFAIISYVAIIVGLLALVTTMIKIVSERRREIGLLRTIGIRKTKVMQIVIFESVFLALIGLILGLIDGYIMGYTVVQAVGAVGGMPWTFDFVMPWEIIVQTIVVALVVAILGAMLPAWQAGRIAPAESLRYTG